MNFDNIIIDFGREVRKVEEIRVKHNRFVAATLIGFGILIYKIYKQEKRIEILRKAIECNTATQETANAEINDIWKKLNDATEEKATTRKKAPTKKE